MNDIARSPGWHPDPDDARFLRWWNGLGWSDARRTADGRRAPLSTAPVLNAPPAPVAPTARRPGSTVPRTSSSTVPPPSGGPIPGPRRAPQVRTQNSAATSSLVLGVLSFPFGFLILPSVLAIVLGLLGVATAIAAWRRGGRPAGLPVAVIGLLLGAVTLAQHIAPIVHSIGTELGR